MDDIAGYQIERYEIGLKGIVPMKMDKYHGLPDPKTDEGYKKQAEDKVYRCENGNIGIPTNAIKKCSILSSSMLGKKMEAKKNRETVTAGLFFDEEFMDLGRKDHDGIVSDLVTRKVGGSITRVITYRPLIKKWEGVVHATVMFMPSAFLRQALDLGGLRYGLLSHRPDFGRYVVTQFKKEGEENDGETT